MTRSSRPTIRDVARAAGVSPGTASAVLTGAAAAGAGSIRASAATRERVEAAARALDYRPNAAARALRGHSRLIGVIVDHPPAWLEFSQRYLLGIQRELYARGYHVLLGTADDQPDSLATWLAECERHSVAGILFVAAGTLTEHLRGETVRSLAAAHLPPCAVVGAEVGRVGVAAVCNSGWSAGYAAAAHLVRLGHRRLLTVGMGAARLAGCEQALAEAGLAPERALVQWQPCAASPGLAPERGRPERASGCIGAGATVAEPVQRDPDWAFALGRLAVRETYGGVSHPPHVGATDGAPAGILTNNDEYAAGVLAALQARGWRVPEHVALVGADNEPFGAHLSVPLTTIDWNVPEIVRRAVLALLDAIERGRAGAEQPCHVETVAPRLVVRASCGAWLRAAGGDSEPARPSPSLPPRGVSPAAIDTAAPDAAVERTNGQTRPQPRARAGSRLNGHDPDTR